MARQNAVERYKAQALAGALREQQPMERIARVGQRINGRMIREAGGEEDLPAGDRRNPPPPRKSICRRRLSSSIAIRLNPPCGLCGTISNAGLPLRVTTTVSPFSTRRASS